MNSDDHTKPSNVYTMDDGIRLTRNNAKRSRCYDRKLNSLCDLGKQKVIQLEEGLYSQRKSINCCESENLHHPEGKYFDDSGVIWFYFSHDEDKFILTDFALTSGGGGKMAVPTNSRPSFFHTANNNDQIQRDIAAKIAAEHHPNQFWHHHRIGEFRRFAMHSRRSNLSLDCDNLFSLRLCTNKAPPAERDRFPGVNLSMGLPIHARQAESAFAYSVEVPEQLASPYARQIIRGEYICELGAKYKKPLPLRLRRNSPLGGNNEVIQPAMSFCWSREILLRRSKAILDSISGGEISYLERDDEPQFLSLILTQNDILTDQKLFQLLHWEMLYWFAHFVGNGFQAHRIVSSKHCKKGTNDENQHYFHKYYLISRLSDACRSFFTDNDGFDIDVHYIVDLIEQRSVVTAPIKLYLEDILGFERENSVFDADLGIELNVRSCDENWIGLKQRMEELIEGLLDCA